MLIQFLMSLFRLIVRGNHNLPRKDPALDINQIWSLLFLLYLCIAWSARITFWNGSKL